MDDCRKGTIIIKSKKEKGLFKKRTVYGGIVKVCPSVYGYSFNEPLSAHKDLSLHIQIV